MSDPERVVSPRTLAARARRAGLRTLRELRDEMSSVSLLLGILAFALLLFVVLPSELDAVPRALCAAGAALAALLAVGLLRANEAARIVAGCACALLAIAAVTSVLEAGRWIWICAPAALLLLRPSTGRRFAAARAARRDAD